MQTSAERPRSRLGGAILLAAGAAIAAGVVIAVIVLSGGGSARRHRPIQATSDASSTSTSTSTAAAQPIAQINLNSPRAHGAAKGIAEVLAQGATDDIAIVATGLDPNSTHPPNAYAVWLYNSPTDSHILGFVNPGVGRNGRLQAATPLPSDAAHYRGQRHQLREIQRLVFAATDPERWGQDAPIGVVVGGS